MEKKLPNMSGLKIKHQLKQKQKTVQRFLIAGSVFSAFAFIAGLIYWNLGMQSDALAGISYTWNGSADSLWTNSNNWTPSGVPGINDQVTIPSSLTRYPVLGNTAVVSDISLSPGAQLNLNGNSMTLGGSFTMSTSSTLGINGGTFTINGIATFSAGTLSGISGNGSVITNGTSTVFGNGTSGPTVNVDVVVNSAAVTMRNTVFNGKARLTKTGTTNDAAAGNNTFNDSVFIANTGTGYWIFSNATRDIYNAPITLSTTNSGVLYMAYNGTNSQFNGDVLFNSSGGGIRIGASNGTSTLAAGKILGIGNLGFSSGSLQLSRLTIAGNADQALTLTGSAVLSVGPATVFPGNVTVISPGISLNGATFNGTLNATKNGSSNNHGAGNNTFNGVTTITHAGTGYMTLANATRDIFNAEVTFTSVNNGVLHVAHNGTNTQFNDHVYVNSTSGGGVRFGSSSGTSTISAGKTIRIGSLGCNSGVLQLAGITFPSGNFTINLGNTATLTLGPSTTFTGNAFTSSGGLCLSGCTFNGKLTAVKTGSSNDNGSGNNTYNDSVEVINNGTGYVVLSNSTRDIFNAPATFSSLAAGNIYVAHQGANTMFNDNVFVNSTAGGGVRIGVGNGTCVLADGKTVQPGISGFSSGNLMLGAMTFGASLPQSFSVGQGAIVSVGPSAVVPGNLTIEAGGICMNGGLFGGKVNLRKTGTSNNSGNGNNTFNDSLTIINDGTGYIVFSNSNKDVYNKTVTVNTTSSGVVYFAHAGANTEFNDHVILNSTGSGGTRIGAGTGTCTLASGKRIEIGAAGFTAGVLTIARLTQTGSTPLSLNLGSGAIVNMGPSLVLNGDVAINSGGVCFNGATFNGILSVTKTGSSNDAGNGNNFFQSNTSITNAGSGYLLFANSTRDIFNGTAEFTCSGTGLIHIAYDGVLTEFNGDLIVNSNSPAGIRFGGGTGTTQLASGKRLLIGAGGYTNGELNLRRFTQLGNTPQSLQITSGSASLSVGPSSVFNSVIDVNFPQVLLNGATFNSGARIEKNGAGNNTSSGGNIFHQQTTIKNSGSGSFLLANTNPDDFNSHVNFIQTGSGALIPSNNSNSTFAGNISTDSSTTAITFANAASGFVTLNGNTAQQISGHLLFPPTIRRLIINNSNGRVSLNVPLVVSHSLNMTSGVLYSGSTNLLSLGAAVLNVANVSNSSYVDGPVRKTGNTAFTFPVGKGGYYRPISITAPTASTDQFTAEYYKLNPDSAYPVNNKESSLYTVSRCEFWTLQRNIGASNVRVSLSWQSPVSCGITAIGDLRVARWDVLASRWNDLGNTSFSGDVNAGTLQANLPGTPYGVFSLGSSSAANSLPIELISFTAAKEGEKAVLKWATQSEKNNDYFTIERSADGSEFTSLGTVNGAGNTVTRKDYSFIDHSPLDGQSYYRLKQTDYNGESETFRAVVLDFGKSDQSFSMTSVAPNPFINELQVNFNTDADGIAEFLLYNVQGAVCFRELKDVTRGSNTINLSILNDLPYGIYFLKMNAGDRSTEPVKLVRK